VQGLSMFEGNEFVRGRLDEIAFETERVKLVCSHLGLTRFEKEMSDAWAGAVGEKKGRLTFDVFRDFFPTFPMILEAQSHLCVRDRLRPVHLFRDFSATFLLDSYMEAFARWCETEKRPIGVVVRFDGFVGGMLIHNGDFDTRETRMIHDVPGDRPPYRVTVEPFITVLKYLARSGWSPEGESVRVEKQGPKVGRGFRVYPWMTERLGCSPARDVLAFLCKVLRSRSGYYRKFIHAVSGTRFVAIDCDALATQTGLSRHQVKLALQSLREAALITTERKSYHGQVMNHILLEAEAMRRA
jgi:hypothetical protein